MIEVAVLSTIDVIYLDFKKAFDSVAHNRLLIKLHHAGFRGPLLNWIRSFLTRRRQRVLLRNGVSQWAAVKSGVPQGSILGPVFFLLFVNDLPDSVLNSVKLFADDTKLYGHAENTTKCLNIQQDLNKLSAWANNWLLNFNSNKCTVIRIRESVKFAYSLGGKLLKQVDSQRDLGITITSDLKPSNHIHRIVKTANQKIGMIKRCFSNRSEETVTLLYKAIIRPTLEYAAPSWSPWLKKDKDLLEKTQKRCLSLCPSQIVLPSLESRRKETDLCETFKYVTGKYNTKAEDLFDLNQNRQGLRGHRYKISKKHVKSDITKNSFTKRVINDWNALPAEIVESETVDQFKKKMRSLLKA